MTRVALAVEVEIPDWCDPLSVKLDSLKIEVAGDNATHIRTYGDIALPLLRFEVHSDPDAIFQPEEEREGDEETFRVTVSQEEGYDGPWTARCTCGWSKTREYATVAQGWAVRHGEDTGHDASGV